MIKYKLKLNLHTNNGQIEESFSSTSIIVCMTAIAPFVFFLLRTEVNRAGIGINLYPVGVVNWILVAILRRASSNKHHRHQTTTQFYKRNHIQNVQKSTE